jgi:hypothetical protein
MNKERARGELDFSSEVYLMACPVRVAVSIWPFQLSLLPRQSSGEKKTFNFRLTLPDSARIRQAPRGAAEGEKGSANLDDFSWDGQKMKPIVFSVPNP